MKLRSTLTFNAVPAVPIPPPVPVSVVSVTSAAVTCEEAFIARMEPPFEFTLTASERKLPEGVAVEDTVPMLISPLAFKITDAKLLLEFAVIEVALRSVFELIVTDEPNGLVDDAVRVEALSTVAPIDPFVAVNTTLPVVSMRPLLTEVPDSETFPPPEAIPLVLTELPLDAIETGPPVVVMGPNI